MKFKRKIDLMTIIPLVALGLVVATVGIMQVNSAMRKQAQESASKYMVSSYQKLDEIQQHLSSISHGLSGETDIINGILREDTPALKRIATEAVKNFEIPVLTF